MGKSAEIIDSKRVISAAIRLGTRAPRRALVAALGTTVGGGGMEDSEKRTARSGCATKIKRRGQASSSIKAWP